MRSRAVGTGAEEEIVPQQVRVAGPARAPRLRRGPPLLVHDVLLLLLPPEDPAEDLHAGGLDVETTVTIEDDYPLK